MALSVNQTYKNYYTIRLGSLTTQHQIQSNRIMLFTNEVTDIASKINFFENQKVLTLATPSNEKLAIGAKYFDLPANFDPADESTWSTIVNANGSAKSADHPYYTTPCQKQLFIYKKMDASDPELANYTNSDPNNFHYSGNKQVINGQNYVKIPYTQTNGEYNGGLGNPNAGIDAQAITDSRVLSNRLMTGEFTFMYTDDVGKIQQVGYKDLTFITESQDKTAYQETVQQLEAERTNINNMQKGVQQEMQTTEVQIQALQSMMESTDKVLTKNTETFKWGA